ncbi:hypothetical protein AVEN_251823-1 [Araneus ventricosus]|uniref:Uncharacterized protein n=1 Tax=Araneus ventricosus TaxID=182803 RepID=A0A4Y2UDN6_ARAVE|nr:hypothetical protein AVEN_251823-1 [Araneus ventricosus]
MAFMVPSGSLPTLKKLKPFAYLEISIYVALQTETGPLFVGVEWKFGEWRDNSFVLVIGQHSKLREHVDTRPSRIARDNADAEKLSQWLSEHNPFPKIDEIMSIDSGIVGGNEVNCHLSEEIGRDMISKMMGKNFENVKFKRKDKVVTRTSINNSVKICNICIVVDPHILFHRLCIAKLSDDDLKAFFKFELSPFPI